MNAKRFVVHYPQEASVQGVMTAVSLGKDKVLAGKINFIYIVVG